MKIKFKGQSSKLKVFLNFILILSLLVLFYPQKSSAVGPLTALSDTMSRLQKSTVKSDHTIKYTTPTGVAAGQNMQITFPTGFAIGTVDYTDIDVSWGPSTGAENELTLAATASGTTWGAAFAGQVLSITSGTGTITGTSKVIIEIGLNATFGVAGDQQIQNHATAATYVISIAGTFTDTGKIAIVILDNDQVIVSTTIDPYLTFIIDQNTVTLTKLGGDNPDYQNTGFNSGTANTLAANTNANTGYNISYNGVTLTRTGGSETIDAMAAKATSSTGTEQFGINLRDNATPNTGVDPTGSGSGSPAADYNTVDQYKFVAGTTTTLASAATATVSNTFTATYIVNVTQTTEAGAYSTTLTYICTGNF